MKFVGYMIDTNNEGDIIFDIKMTESLLQATRIRKGDLFTLTQNTKGELVLVNCEEKNSVTDD